MSRRTAAGALRLLCLLLGTGCGGTAPRTAPEPSTEGPLARLLQANPTWRLAERSDCRSDLLEAYGAEHPGYHPYRLLGDIDGDGRPELVVALAEGEGEGVRFHIFWFRGEGGGFGAPQPLGVTDLSDGGIVAMPGGVYLGPFFSDAGQFYTWDRGAGRLAPHDPFGE